MNFINNPHKPAPRCLRRRNQFNAARDESIKLCPPFSEQDVRDELVRRQLSDSGSLMRMWKRLQAHNKNLLTTQGQYKVHLLKLADLKKARLDAIVPIAQYANTPAEIRIMIWEFSLPGPRVLTTSSSPYYATILNSRTFLKKENPANPAALFVCQESRKVALKHYRLVFGSQNVYANLSYDILYFGSTLSADKQEGLLAHLIFWETNWRILGPNFPSFYNADLKAFNYVALHRRAWEGLVVISHSVGLRPQVEKAFPHAKRLMLVETDTDDIPGRFSLTPGHIELERTSQTVKYRSAYAQFSHKRGYLQAVAANRVAEVPGENWEFDYGEPYYPKLAGENENVKTSEDDKREG